MNPKSLKKPAPSDPTLPNPHTNNNSQRNKITFYMPNRPHNLQSNSSQPKSEGDRGQKKMGAAELEAAIKEREREYDELMRENVGYKQQQSQYRQQLLENKKKTRQMMAKWLLELAQRERCQRSRRQDNLGRFINGGRTFVQGTAIVSLRQQLEEKQALVRQLTASSRKRHPQDQDHRKNVYSIEYIKREIQILKRELEMREKEVASYKDRIKLVEKELRCEYMRRQWPIICDKYQTLCLLGQGGFGQVYKCVDLDTYRNVAIKRLAFNPNLSDDKADFLMRIRREADIHKTLSHPNIVKLHQWLQQQDEEGVFMFEVEYCSGPQLSVYLRRHTCLEQKEARIIIKQLFSALEYLSSFPHKSIIHYDIKPGNIMFADGVVKLLDFGLCKEINSQDTRIELTSPGMGTLWYQPPEAFDNGQYEIAKISPKVDVWAAGMILFELLYGIRPFGATMTQTQYYQSKEVFNAREVQFPEVTPKGSRVSEGCKEFIRGCLKYEYGERLNAKQAYQHHYLQK